MYLVRVYRNYRRIYPGFRGVSRLFFKSIDAVRKGGFKGLRNRVLLHERIVNRVPVSVGTVAQQCCTERIGILRTHLEKYLFSEPTILFDHNGGGGSNVYTNELVKAIHIDGGSVLRVYCYESVWIVQWIGGDGMVAYCTPSIDELFEALYASHSKSIVVNSVYGYPDIEKVTSNIIHLARQLSAALDIKIHDFYALCPSPHLVNFKGKYCGVPQDPGVCKSCIKQNLDWYHGWYPKKNRPLDVDVWRTPFADIFDAATTITFFDQSSVEIVRKAFILDDSKVKVIPHVISYFKCNNKIELKGALHIGVLGTLSHMKGGEIVKMLYEYINKQGLQIPFTVVGSSLVDTPPGISVHGDYSQNNLPAILGNYGINVILMPSVVPETFSYTISEAMEMGLPIVAFDIGAQGRRVKQYKLGRVVPLGSSPNVILSAIQSASKAARELKI